jgi:hypothetical protein
MRTKPGSRSVPSWMPHFVRAPKSPLQVTNTTGVVRFSLGRQWTIHSKCCLGSSGHGLSALRRAGKETRGKILKGAFLGRICVEWTKLVW